MNLPTLSLHPSQITDGELAELFGVDPKTGLTAAEAAHRLEVDGPNELRQKPPEPLWHKVVRQFQDPLVYLLLVAMVISFAAWMVEGSHGFPVDIVVIAVIVILNGAIGFVQENKAANAVSALAKMTAANATVVRDGELNTVPSSELVRGDILSLAEGDAVGADARLISTAGLRIQEASLTGESEAVTKDTHTIAELAQIGDRHNMVHKGTAVVQGVGRAIITGTGMGTEVGAIAELLEETESEPSPLEVEIAQISKMLGLLVIAIAVVVMGALALINGIQSPDDLVQILLMGVSLAVAAVPEGLPAILSVVLAIGVQVLARRNAVMKNLRSVETLGSVSVICSDKTGTLTRNEMTLRTIVTAAGTVDLSGTGYRPDGEPIGNPSEDALAEALRAVVVGAVANNAQLRKGEEWEIVGDPTEGAFLVAAKKVPGASERMAQQERIAEIPFSSERKRMSVLSHDNLTGDNWLFTKGAPDVLLDHCNRQSVGTKNMDLDDARRAEILAEVDRLSGAGYRTLGVAVRSIDPLPDDLQELDESLEHDLIFLGMVGIIDPPREEAAAAVADAHRAGVRTVMITGDHPLTAKRIADDLGITAQRARVATGMEIDAMSDEEFLQASREVSVYARVAPVHKLKIVDALQRDRHVVSMTGDGVNDAPALKAADIGVAMGITGTEVTKEAGTMILADDNYATILVAVRQGRVIYDNIRKFLRYLLSSNMGEVVTVFFGVVLAGFIGLRGTGSAEGIVVPLLATQILWINLVTDSAPALAMGVDPEVGDVMARSPRRPGERMIDTVMWMRVIFTGVVMGTVTLLTIDMFLPGGLIQGTDSVDVARTAGFTTLVIAQLFNALNARSDATSAFRHLFANHWLWAAIALGAIAQLAVVELPFLQSAFGTASLDMRHVLASFGMASVVLWVEEILKIFVRMRRRAAEDALALTKTAETTPRPALVK